jgi:DNA repair exonuclease SbcCD ATPase subunit
VKIVKLQAENVKRLRAVEITPDPNDPLVLVSGRNAQGKTSVLDSIYFALAGASAQKETVRPIRDGEDHAEVTLDLGDLIVRRKWTANDKSYLSVESADGASYKSPQQVLDRLTGALAFDPLEFSRMDAKKQKATLLSLVNLPVSLDELDAHRAGLYELRREIGRDLDKAKAQVDGITLPPDCPADEISMGAVMEELEAAQNVLEENEAKRERLGAMRDKATEIQAEIANLKDRITELEEQKAALCFGGKALAAEVAALVDPDVSAIKEKMAGLDEHNRKARLRREFEARRSEAKQLAEQRDALTAQIEAIDAQKATMLREAAFPVPGLGFDESGVTFNGVPFSQASGAEQLRVSLAMAMALNPKLRVIRITDGSLLDSDNLALIREMAGEKGFQVWIEAVDDSGKVGIYIEDGEVRG